MITNDKIITLDQAKSMFTSRTYKDGYVHIEWEENEEMLSMRFKREAFYQAGRFWKTKAIELATEAGYTVNELTQYQMTGNELKAFVEKNGGVDVFSFLLGVNRKEVLRECALQDNLVKPIYYLCIHLLNMKRNLPKVKALSKSA